MQIEKKLLTDISGGDERAIFQLYRWCHQNLQGVCRRYSINEDDWNVMFNNGFLKIVKNIDRYREEIPFEAWAKRILINTSIDHFRRNKKYRDNVDYPGDERAGHDIEDHLDFNAADKLFDAEQLLVLIRRLPPVSGQVFNLFAIDGFSHKEIGEMLEITEGTSKWHLSCARKKLQEMLESALGKKVEQGINSIYR